MVTTLSAVPTLTMYVSGIMLFTEEILSKVVDGSKSGGLFFNSIFELDSRQYLGDQFRAVESLKASLGAHHRQPLGF